MLLGHWNKHIDNIYQIYQHYLVLSYDNTWLCFCFRTHLAFDFWFFDFFYYYYFLFLLFISNTFVPLSLYLHTICQQRVAANKGATEATGPSGEVERLTVDIMNLLTVTEYLCHKWLQICSVCRNHNPIYFMHYLSQCM